MIAILPAGRTRARFAAAVRGGTASIVAGAAFSNVLRIVSSMTLTRLLSAEAFGVVGVVLSVQLILTMLSDVGLYPFIVGHQRAGERDFLDEVWTLRMVRSVGLTVLMAALAWPAAAFMGKPELAPVLALFSLIFVLEGLSSLTFATAVREQSLWRLASLDAAGAALQLAFSVAAALVLGNSWSLVVAMLIGAGARTVLSYVIFPGSGRRVVFNAARARELWAFSRAIAASSFLTLIILQADKLVLARLMPLAVYGHYVIAATLATAPVPLAGAYAHRVLYPAYVNAAKVGRTELRRVLYAKRRAVVLLFMAGAGGLAGGAGLVVRILYDRRYDEVAPLLALLTVSTIVYPATISANEALMALNRPRWPFYATATRVTWLGLGGFAAFLAGSTPLLVAVVGLMEVAALGCFWLGLARAGVLNPREEGLGLSAAALGAATGYALSAAAAAWFP